MTNTEKMIALRIAMIYGAQKWEESVDSFDEACLSVWDFKEKSNINNDLVQINLTPGKKVYTLYPEEKDVEEEIIWVEEIWADGRYTYSDWPNDVSYYERIFAVA